jgi:hypothetical protein
MTLGTLEFQDMRVTPGLQAADLIAYEFRHYYDLRETRPDLPVRFPLRTILDHRPVDAPVLMKYLPEWYIEFQASGVGQQAMKVITDDIEKWSCLYLSMQPPGVNGVSWWRRMELLESYGATAYRLLSEDDPLYQDLTRLNERSSYVRRSRQTKAKR